MKRGLIEWNPQELSRETLDGRVARCQALLADRALDAVVFYTSVAQPMLGRYFVHFLPYWNEGLLLLPREGEPTLFVALSNRVFPWIKGSSTLNDVRASRNLGGDAAKLLVERGARRVGLGDRGSIPFGVIAALESGLAGGEVVDLPQVVQTMRLGLDADELRLRGRAAALATAALDEVSDLTGLTDSDVASRLDRSVRLAGAEDTLVLVGPTGQFPGLPQRVPIEGAANVMLQVEYKGHWVQLGRTVGAAAPGAGTTTPTSLCEPGRAVGEIVTAARDRHGLDVYLSRCGRGNPFTGLAATDRLAEGDIVAVLALDTASGRLSGDTLAVQAGGVTSLT